MSGHQYLELSTKGAGVTQNSGGSAVRWEQGTCNASFRDEAQKLRNHKSQSNGKKVESHISASKFLFPFLVLKDLIFVTYRIFTTSSSSSGKISEDTARYR